MRRHIVRTTKILAIAAVATGCSTRASAPPVTSAQAATDARVPFDKEQPPTADEPAETVATLATPPPGVDDAILYDTVLEDAVLEEGTAAPTAADGVVGSAQDDEAAELAKRNAMYEREQATRTGPLSKSPHLVSLRDELANLNEAQALEKRARYRPLCDAAGYPLVGNVMRKSITYTATRFCRVVRNEVQGQ